MKISTFHGFRHLTAYGRHWTEYILWVSCIFLAVVGTAYLSGKSWHRYQNFPTVNAIDKDYKNWNTTLPAILVCPRTKLDSRKLKEYVEKIPSEKRETTVAFIKELAKVEYSNLEEIPREITADIPPQNYMLLLSELRTNFQFEEREGAETVVTEMGICYAFNSEASIDHTLELFLSKVRVIPNKTVALEAGSPLGGDLVSVILSISHAYKAQYSSPNDIPDATAIKYTGKTSTFRTFEFEGMSIVCSDRVRSLQISQRRCRFPDESNLAISQKYSYNACRMDCRRNLALRLCQCSPHFYIQVEGNKVCDIDGLRCLAEHKDLLIKLIDPDTKEKVECNCLPTCNDQSYYVEYTQTVKWFLGTCLKWSIVKFPKMRIRRDLIFGFPDLLVSIGGTAGLFLGCSVLSFVEIIYFFTLRLFFHMRARNSG